MAIMDARWEFSDNQDVASGSPSSTTVNSSNLVDLGANAVDYWGDAVTMDVGEAGELVFNCEVCSEATVAGTVTVTLQTAAALSTSHLSSGATIATLTAFAAASAIGTKYAVKVPFGTVQRYLEVVYSIGATALTAGKFNAWIGLDHRT